MMVSTDEIVAYARSWKGAVWRHQGRGEGPSRGIDCIGLLVRTAHHFELPHDDKIGYRRAPGREFTDMIEMFSLPGDWENLHGAIGIFSDTTMPCHTGIFAVSPDTKDVTLIHSSAYPHRRCVEEELDESTPSLKSRLLRVRYFKGVNYGT